MAGPAPDLLELSASFSENPRTRPVLDGEVRVDGVRLLCTPLHPSEMFWRQLHFEEFDVSEMSISSLLISALRGDRRWTAVPIFTMRKFFHTSVLVNSASGVERPQDLKGKRVGVPEYQQTWAVWSRGILKDQFGVEPAEIEWFMERGADRSHGAATGFSPPPGVRIRPVSADTSIGRMLARGELDATLLQLNEPNLIDRGRAQEAASATVRPLFPDPAAEARRYFADTGLYPVNHVVVIRRTVYERHPWIALNLLKAFEQAKALAFRRGLQALEPYAAAEGRALPAAAPDPMPYGFRVNQPVLERLAWYLADQGLTETVPDIASVFARNTLDGAAGASQLAGKRQAAAPGR